MTADFKGDIKGFDLDNINEETLEVLLDKKVIYLYKEDVLNLEELEIGSVFLRNYMIFNSNCYLINPKLIEEVFFALKECFESNHLESILFDSFEIELKKHLLIKDKKKYINKIYKREFKAFEVKYRDEDEYFYNKETIFIGLCQEEPNSLQWKEYMIDVIKKSPETLKFHLLIGVYNDTSLEFLRGNLEELEWDYISYWEEWLRLDKIEKFCTCKLREITESTINYKNEENRSRRTPLEQVVYIDKLRFAPDVFNLVGNEEKLTHIKNITGGEVYDEKLQLDVLKELINLDTDEFEEMIISDYARKLNQISKTSFSNLRKAISSYRLMIIQKENIKTEKDKKHLEKFNKAQSKIKEANIKISTLF